MQTGLCSSFPKPFCFCIKRNSFSNSLTENENKTIYEHDSIVFSQLSAKLSLSLPFLIAPVKINKNRKCPKTKKSSLKMIKKKFL